MAKFFHSKIGYSIAESYLDLIRLTSGENRKIDKLSLDDWPSLQNLSKRESKAPLCLF